MAMSTGFPVADWLFLRLLFDLPLALFFSWPCARPFLGLAADGETCRGCTPGAVIPGKLWWRSGVNTDWLGVAMPRCWDLENKRTSLALIGVALHDPAQGLGVLFNQQPLDVTRTFL